MAHFEHTLNRLLAIEWWEPVEPSQSDALALINEHFRRIALWCTELNIEGNYWHFTDLAQHFHPDLIMADIDPLGGGQRKEIPDVAGTTRLVMHHALNWAFLMDMYPEIPQLYEYLPHPYEPAIVVFENGVALGRHIYSPEFRLEVTRPRGGKSIGPIFELQCQQYYLDLEPYELPNT